MRSYEAESEPGWDVVLPRDGMSLDGVRMAGFRERAAAGLDLRVLPQPAVVVVIGLGESPFSMEGAHGHQDLPSFAAALTPGRARIRGAGVECVEMRLSPRAAYALLGVSPRELDGSVRGLDDLWGRAGSRLRERLAAVPAWEQRLTLVDRFLAERAARAPAMAPEVAAVTRADFEALCEAAGLSLVSVTPLQEAEPFSLLEAAAAG